MDTLLYNFMRKCELEPITVDELEMARNTNLIPYAHIYPDEASIIFKLCHNPNVTTPIVQWILDNYSEELLGHEPDFYDLGTPLVRLMSNPGLDLIMFKLVIDYILENKSQLKNSQLYLGMIFYGGIKITSQMMEYLYHKEPQLDICLEDKLGNTPIGLIIHSRNVQHIFQIIKMHEPTRRIKIPELATFKISHIKWAVNQHVDQIFNHPTRFVPAGLIFELCGELFELIDRKYFTVHTHTIAAYWNWNNIRKDIIFDREIDIRQAICNGFYSSKFFKENPDQLIHLIPEQFRTQLRDIHQSGLKTKAALRVTY
jgi:hypothetical protein